MDRDRQAIQEGRDLRARARRAADGMKDFTQEQADRVTRAACEAGYAKAEELARLAVEETKMGRVESKTVKNQLCTKDLWESIAHMRTVGLVRRDDARRVYEIADPVGVVAAIIPTTNPTSTALFKAIIALKGRNAIVISPHPRASRCINAAAKVVHDAAVRAGAPEGCVGCLTSPTLEATGELMRHRGTDLILATGGAELVKAAYSAGKPAFGVGPGNVPVFIERSADIERAVRCLVFSKGFDWGTICASEQCVTIDAPVRDRVVAEFRRQGAHLCSPEEKKKLEAVAVRGNLMNPDMVGKPPEYIAAAAGFAVPQGTTLLCAFCDTVGPEEPLSREKLMPVLALYTDPDWEAACRRCMAILRFGGLGHTLVIHSRDQRIILEFALKKQAYRLLVNAPSSTGSVGYGTGLMVSMTLGCGTPGGNISSDNISANHLINIKRLAFADDDPAAGPLAAGLAQAAPGGGYSRPFYASGYGRPFLPEPAPAAFTAQQPPALSPQDIRSMQDPAATPKT
jgi:acetaldehyde dehydrogenase (acetylating)